jgi:hypothetical protein
MQKKVLSEQALYYGDIAMPKGFEIDRDKLCNDILTSELQDCQFPFSRTWDMLNTYMRDHVNVEYGFSLVPSQPFVLSAWEAVSFHVIDQFHTTGSAPSSVTDG